MTYKTAIENLNKVNGITTDEDMVAVYFNASFVVKHIVNLKFHKLEETDQDDIALKIATDLLDRYRREPEFRVRSWPAYLGLLIQDEYKKNYKNKGTLISLSQYDYDEVDEELQIVAEEIDTDTLVDFKCAVENVYLTYQRLVNNCLIEDQEVIDILERIVVHAAAIDESILKMLPQPYKRIASANFSILRRVFTNYKKVGLLVSKQNT